MAVTTVEFTPNHGIEHSVLVFEMSPIVATADSKKYEPYQWMDTDKIKKYIPYQWMDS